MMKKRVIQYTLIFILLLGIVWGQYGKNKVRYDDFNWKYIQTEHFDIYFYDDGQELAEFAAPIAEEQIDRIANVLHWKLNKRVPLIIYNSHSDFQQTNVTLSYLTEGVQGFTELFKNRAVLAYEGDYHGFWHVLRHELSHVMVNDMIYGGNIQSVISGRVQLQIPLWMHEGLAEFVSIGWDTNSDMIIRDIALANDIPDIKYLDYYLAYKGGQSVYRFIADKYGVEKIGEIWRKMKSRRNVEKGLEAAVGMNSEELSKEWHKWVRELYWPDIADREELEDIATRLTDHQKLENYFNTAPTIAPNGKSIAIISDRDDYADIILISATDGKMIKKVIRGQRTPALEEMKYLYPRLSWSPDGRHICLAVKSGKTDALTIVEVETGELQQFTFEPLEGIFSAAWSPDGKQIAFIGLQDGQTDLYTYELESEELNRLTNDRFSDFEPAWSPDNQKLVFAAQRGHRKENQQYGSDSRISEYNYHQTDLFYYDLITEKITRLTDTPWNENSPVWAHTQNSLIFTSDSNGVNNLYITDLAEIDPVAITNVLTGAFQPSLSQNDSRLVFAGYADRGWDVYTLSNPLEMITEPKKVKPTLYAQELKKQWQKREAVDQLAKLGKTGERSVTRKVSERGSYSNYIFAPGYSSWEEYNQTAIDTVTPRPQLDTLKNRDESGAYVVRPYKTKFSLDYVESQAGYSTFWGFQGTTVFSFSDIMGNHRFTFGTEMYVDLENSDYYFSYQYLTNRINYGFTGFHMANFYATSVLYLWRWRNYGADFSASLPFTKFSRLEFGSTWFNVEQNLVSLQTGQSETISKIHTLLPRTAFVFDNSLWGFLYPIDGWRGRLDYIVSPKYDQYSLEFMSLQLDLRRYFKLNDDYSFALRLSTGASFGENAQYFFVGGESNWLNQKFKRYHHFENANEIYFSEFVTPLRGARYYEREGTRYFLMNYEFRYPFIEYLKLGWPLPMTLGGIQGVTFLDMGTAWKEDLHPFGYNPYRGFYMDELVGGFGIGSRIFLGYFVLKIDVAWRFDLDKIDSPMYYFSLGLDY